MKEFASKASLLWIRRRSRQPSDLTRTGCFERRTSSLRVTLTRLYVDGGYVNSGVLLPDQEIKEGIVMYRAVEGSLTRVELVGDPECVRNTFGSCSSSG